MGTTTRDGRIDHAGGRLSYMPALDGLRALAVIAVLLYHGNVSWASGGYFGVDAFFVLSGFLITSLLLAEWRRPERHRPRAFWVRRARRLLPALVLVVVAVALYAARSRAADRAATSCDATASSTLGYVANWNQIFAAPVVLRAVRRAVAVAHTSGRSRSKSSSTCSGRSSCSGRCAWARLDARAARRACALLGIGSAVLDGGALPRRDTTRHACTTAPTPARSRCSSARSSRSLLARRRGIASRRAQRALHGGAIAAAIALAFIWSTTSEHRRAGSTAAVSRSPLCSSPS